MFSLGQYSYNFDFNQLSTSVGKSFFGFQTATNRNKLLENKIYMSPQRLDHLRISYSFLYLIGDVGGVYQSGKHIFGFFLVCISKYSFYYRFIKQLFLIKTNDESIICHDKKYDRPDHQCKGIQKYLSKRVIDQIDDNSEFKSQSLNYHHKLSLSLS